MTSGKRGWLDFLKAVRRDDAEYLAEQYGSARLPDPPPLSGVEIREMEGVADRLAREWEPIDWEAVHRAVAKTGERLGISEG